MTSDGGKGSAPRKERDDAAYAANWDLIFKSKMDYKVKEDVVVSSNQAWKLIDESSPQGVKVLLIDRKAGVATLGHIDEQFTHWAPLPRFED